MKRVAMITVHECPLASSEGKERGGINVYTFELSKALTRLGWQVDAFTRIQDDVNPRIVQVNDRFRVIHLPNGPHTPLSKKEILRFLPEFTKALAPYINRYKIVHAHYYISGTVAETLKIPFIMTFHTLGLMKQLVSRGVSEDPNERIGLERKLAKSAKTIITASDAGKEYLTAMYDAAPEHVVTIPPGVDTTLFHPMDKTSAKKRIGADPKHHVILSVGRIDPVKGFDVLLIALKMLFQRNPNLGGRVCLWIVGGDVEQPKSQWSRELKRLDELRSALHLATTVRFVPPQPQEELPYYYNAADVLVMPSHYESFGMVALEAAASGTPVIATDVTGISSVLKDLPGGHIVSANNPIALSEEIAHVLEKQHESEAVPLNDFTWERIAKRMEGVYKALLAAGS